MNLLLTDQLSCPRCRAEGLILLADRVADRRVQEGQLGCPNCRARFPVKNGLADFAEAEPDRPHDVAEYDAVRLAAMLGVSDGRAMLLLVGAWLETPARVAAMLPDLELVVAQPTRVQRASEAGVSRLHIAENIPLRSASMHAAAVAPGAAHLLAEAARVCRLAGRLVLLGAPNDAQTLRELGLHVAAQQGDTIVAVRQS